MRKIPDSHIVIYSDGACMGNPGPGGWGSILITPEKTVFELGGSERSTTNNRMEIMGAMAPLRQIEKVAGPVLMFTDSTYLIRGITEWIFGWRKRGWKSAQGEPVANQDLWEELDQLVRQRGSRQTVKWNYVRGHQGTPGNERCDEIAVAMSQGKSPKLFSGSLSSYGVNVEDLPEPQELPPLKDFRSEKKAPLFYLSNLGGIVYRHRDWASCERRVKGQSGAKFKKITSPTEEIEVLKSWGSDPGKVRSE